MFLSFPLSPFLSKHVLGEILKKKVTLSREYRSFSLLFLILYSVHILHNNSPYPFSTTSLPNPTHPPPPPIPLFLLIRCLSWHWWGSGTWQTQLPWSGCAGSNGFDLQISPWKQKYLRIQEPPLSMGVTFQGLLWMPEASTIPNPIHTMFLPTHAYLWRSLTYTLGTVRDQPQ